jgi:hypothetical protein
MSTDEPEPTRAQPSFQPAQPAVPPGRPSFQPGDPGYQRTNEPKTVAAESLQRSPGQADPPQYGRPPSDPPQYGRPPSDTPQYGSGGQYDSTQKYDATKKWDAGQQYGTPPSDTPQYGSAQYGQESGYDSPPPQSGRGRPPRRNRRKRRVIISVFAVVVVLILLVIGDFVAKAVAEYEIANQITQADNSIHPSVGIQGFPFLTQVISRDLQEIDLSASNVPVASSGVTITSVHAAAKGIHINGAWNGGEVDSISGTVFISFSSLSTGLSQQSQGIANISLTAAGPHSINASFGVEGANLLSETGTVTINGSQVKVTWSQSSSDNSGILGTVLGSSGSLPDLNFTLPKLPAGLQVKSFQVTSSGVSITVAAQHTTLSQ